MSPTIKDVAATARTSIKTVSRVINQELGVAAEMREKVRQLVQTAVRLLLRLVESQSRLVIRESCLPARIS